MVFVLVEESVVGMVGMLDLEPLDADIQLVGGSLTGLNYSQEKTVLQSLYLQLGALVSILDHFVLLLLVVEIDCCCCLDNCWCLETDCFPESLMEVDLDYYYCIVEHFAAVVVVVADKALVVPIVVAQINLCLPFDGSTKIDKIYVAHKKIRRASL